MDLLSYSLEAKEGQVIRRHSQLELKRHRHFFKEAFFQNYFPNSRGHGTLYLVSSVSIF